MKIPLVSIITVVYNGEKYIKDTIESVINQTYSNIEYIIIDGGSTDGTMEVLKRYEASISAIISEQDNGIYDAMNKGINMASGDIVGIINADDYYDRDAVKSIVNAFSHSGADVVYGDKKMLDPKSGRSSVVSVALPKKINDVNVSTVHPTVFVNNKVYNNIIFDESYKIVADRDFFYKVYALGYKFYKLDKIIATMRRGGISSTWFRPLCEGFRVRRKNFGAWYALIFAIRMTGGFVKMKLCSACK
jgi:glycosyltransferase involved in cell wall biosynthesis